MFKAFQALEEESSTCLYRYSKELSFLRSLILEGQWDDVENFLEMTQIREKIDTNQIAFVIGRQRYLELLVTHQLDDQNYLLAVLKNLEELCHTKDQYNELCYLLSLKSINEHPDYSTWSIQKGRLDCFESLKVLMQDIFGADVAFERRKTPANRLLKLLKESVQY